MPEESSQRNPQFSPAVLVFYSLGVMALVLSVHDSIRYGFGDLAISMLIIAVVCVIGGESLRRLGL